MPRFKFVTGALFCALAASASLVDLASAQEPVSATSPTSAAATSAPASAAFAPPARARLPRPGATESQLKEWFERYDEIRRSAQMSPAERKQADELMSKGLSIIVPGEEKDVSQKLLNRLVARYASACEKMKGLPLYSETEKLHRGYYQYFLQAQQLFGDYLKVQNNLFAQDASGNPVAASLMNRKQQLETLDTSNKTLDGELRARFKIAEYRY